MGNYLAYALGEIVLVVIGILIALQLNNWNEQRKNRVFEREVLLQIRANLIQDRLALQAVSLSFGRAMASSEKLIDRSVRAAHPDSIPFWLGDVAMFERFRPITNSYEVLKSKGLENVQDSKVRKLLGSYYDVETPRVYESMRDLEFAFNQEWVPLMREHVVEFRFGERLILDDYGLFFKTTHAERILILHRDNFGAGYQHVNRVIIAIGQLLELLPTPSDNEQEKETIL